MTLIQNLVDNLSKKLVDLGHTVVGLDNINDYYDVNLKFARLKELGIDKKDASRENCLTESFLHTFFRFVKMDLSDKKNISELFEKERFDIVCNFVSFNDFMSISLVHLWHSACSDVPVDCWPFFGS